MDEVLCQLSENDSKHTFVDDYISDDEELLPINCYKLIQQTTNQSNDTTVQLNEDQSTNNEILASSPPNNLTTIQTNCHSNEPLSNDSKEDQVNNELKSTSLTHRVTYYSECPVCYSLGPKSINHIKQCAQKRSIHPKQVLQLLKGCQKSNISDQTHKPKNNSNPKRKKKSTKKLDNYVISFEDKKSLKLAINPELVCNKKPVNKPMNYELSLLDINSRQILLESKISDQILCNVVSNFADQQHIDNIFLPNLWKLSLLQSQSTDYIVQDFHKYHVN